MRIYISHPIMGVKKKDATDEDITTNCNIAKEITKKLRKKYPKIEFYLPAEYEDFVHRAYKMGYLTVQQILDIDCSIIESCSAVVFLNFQDTFSSGMIIEQAHAMKHNLPCLICNNMDNINLDLILY